MGGLKLSAADGDALGHISWNDLCTVPELWVILPASLHTCLCQANPEPQYWEGPPPFTCAEENVQHHASAEQLRGLTDWCNTLPSSSLIACLSTPLSSDIAVT